MKKTLTAIFVILFVLSGWSVLTGQYLTSSESATNDSIVLAGATDAGTAWFTNTGQYDVIFVEVKAGTYWYSYKLDYPGKMLGSLRGYVEGSDTTFYVQSDQGGLYIVIPGYYYALVSGTGLLPALSINYDATTNPAATPILVRFRGVKAPFLRNY